MKYANYIIVLLVGIVAVLVLTKEKNLGGAPSGLAATNATSSTITVPTYVNNPLIAVTAFGTTTLGSANCLSRVVTTAASAVLFTFGEQGTTTYPTGTFGHLQAASTTVSYDAGIYGCGRWKVIGSGPSSIITVTEFR